MDIFWMLIIITACIGLIVIAVKMSRKGIGTGKADRKCLSCGYEGKMKTWLGNHSGPQLITLVLLLFYVVPGIIFIIWAQGKYKCPNCGAIGKNSALQHKAADSLRPCPFCAESIKVEAIKCKHCGSTVPAS